MIDYRRLKPHDPRTAAIYEQLMLWMERGDSPEVRIPLPPKSDLITSYEYDGSAPSPVFRILAFRAGAVDRLTNGKLRIAWADLVGYPTTRIYYHPEWRGVLTIEKLLKE